MQETTDFSISITGYGVLEYFLVVVWIEMVFAFGVVVTCGFVIPGCDIN